jgi:eukaryotic-like serine/threonine-protein kinase
VVYDPEVPRDLVVSTDPGAGEKLAEGETISYSVSNGPAPVPVPDIAGKTPEEATALLQAQGLELGPESRAEPNETIPDGSIIAADFAEPTALPDTAIPYVRSSGPAPRVLSADLFGVPFDAASTQLTAARITPVRGEDVFSETVAVGSVVGYRTADGVSDLPVGSVLPADSQVMVIVSKGHAPVKIPDVRDRPAAAATQDLAKLGFVVNINGDAGKRVLETTPRVGSEAPYGSTITIVTY